MREQFLQSKCHWTVREIANSNFLTVIIEKWSIITYWHQPQYFTTATTTIAVNAYLLPQIGFYRLQATWSYDFSNIALNTQQGGYVPITSLIVIIIIIIITTDYQINSSSLLSGVLDQWCYNWVVPSPRSPRPSCL